MQRRNRPIYRRARVLLPVLVLLVAGLAATVWADNAVNRGVTYRPTPPPIPWADVPQLGVNLYNIQFEAESAKVTRTLELARAMGAHFVRLQMPWDDVEIHAKGDFEDRRNPQHVRSAWEKYDFIISETTRLGLEPIVRIDRAPAWARQQANATPAFQRGFQENANSTGPPDDYQDYFDFVGAFAARYRDDVRFIQIWNEPNLAYEWNWQRPDPEQFVELVRGAADAAKAANPEAIILFPSLSPTDGLEPRIAPISELEYLDRVYAAGGGRAFDILSAQAYGLGQPPDEHRYVRLRIPGRDWQWRRPLDTRIDVSRLVLVREVMERNGDAQKAIWVSEFGYNAAPEQVPEADSAQWATRRQLWGTPVTEEQKAAYLVGQLERARREWPWVGVMNVWLLRWGGEAPDPNDPTPYFALVDRDFTPLPAYQRLQAYATAAPNAGVGAHAWVHPAVQQQRGDRWQIRFTGTSLALAGLTAPASVSIDGGPLAEVAAAAGTQSVASGLADAEHTALVQAARAPEAFLVGREQPVAWLWIVLPGALVLAIVAVGAVLGWALV